MAKKFKDALKINRSRINDEMARHPAQLYEVGMKIEALWQKLTALENQLKDREAKVLASTRSKYKRSKIDMTETALKDIVRSDVECIKLREEMFRWKKSHRLAVLKKEVLKARGEMLVNISHNVREEIKKENYHKVKS
jgi:hypothetical protein